MASYLFSNLIKCNRCGKNYRGKRDRNTPVYICSTYNNYKQCERGTVKEIDLIELVEKYCDNNNLKMEYTNEYMILIIKNILCGQGVDLEIIYKDGNTQHLKTNSIKF